MSKEMEFFIYLIEHYADYRNDNSRNIIKELNELDLFDEVYNRYEFYHIERLENAYKDIDKLIESKKM